MAKRPATPAKSKAARAKPEGDDLLAAPPAAPPRAPNPTDFRAILGQDRAIAVLQNAIDSRRVHHAWIFAGPPGVGKLTAAKAFAALLLTPRDAKAKLAPEHQHIMHLLESGSHPDVHVITKELASVSRDNDVRKSKQKNIAKEVLAQFFIEPLAIARTVNVPSIAGKVFIIDEAELLDTGGQNTILKVVEEPPEGAVIIFVTSDLHRLLPTVRSRCQRVTFTALDQKAMQQWVRERDFNLPASDMQWLMVYAAGSPGALLTAVNHGLLNWHRQLEPMLAAIEKPGGRWPALGGAMAALVDERAQEAVRAAPEASKDAANRLWAKRMIGYVAERTRHALTTRAQGGEPADRLLNWLDLCAAAERQLDANVAYATVLENLAAQMASDAAVAA